MKLTAIQLRRIIKEEVQKVVSEAIPGAPAAKRSKENIESLAKKVFVDGDRSSETKLVKQLKKQFGNDGFTWEQTLLDIIGDEYEDSVSEFVYYSNQ